MTAEKLINKHKDKQRMICTYSYFGQEFLAHTKLQKFDPEILGYV
jgi:hypothetical protein